MIDRRPEQSAALQSTRELSCQLLHAIDSRSLGHVLAKHVEILVKEGALIRECRIKHFPAMYRVFNLSKDPRIRHRAAAYQNTVAARFTKTLERLVDGRHVAAARDWNLNYLFNLFHEIPIRKTAITLFLCPPVQCDVLDSARLSQLRGFDCVDRVIVKARTDFDS